MSQTPAAPKAAERPLSPYMIWRWHITMVCSILHRLTGVILYGAALLLAGWALSLALGPYAFYAYRAVLGSLPGKVVLVAITFSLFYHLANGVRHLVGDYGVGLAPKTADATAYLAIGFGAAATVAVWVAAGVMGALA
jgi:succinate dehydrogenase / fumarate reductase, cytochrome b subunit